MTLFRKYFLFLSAFNIFAIIFAAENLHLSHLELFPGRGLEPVLLKYPYAEISPKDKEHCLFLTESCYTILNHDDTEKTSVLVGPLYPCQFLCLRFERQTIIAHISSESNFSELLYTIKKQFTECSPSQITGELYTTHMEGYDKKYLYNGSLSWQMLTEGRSQLEELKKKKDILLESFNIPNRSQIKAYKFTPDKTDDEYGNYLSAYKYVIVKIINEKPVLFNTSLMAENFFGGSSDLPIEHRRSIIYHALENIERPAVNLHFEKYKTDDNCSTYGTVSCYHIKKEYIGAQIQTYWPSQSSNISENENADQGAIVFTMDELLNGKQMSCIVQ